MNASEIITIVLSSITVLLGVWIVGYCYGYRQGVRAMRRLFRKEVDESEDKMNKPTKEEYEQAKKSIDMFKYYAEKARDAQARLIDDLIRARQDELGCMAEAERCVEIIHAYESWSMKESEDEDEQKVY